MTVVSNGASPSWRLCTIAAKNYIPSAVLLARSFSAHHPGIPITVLVVDATNEDVLDGLPFETLLPDDLRLDSDTFARMATYYDAIELSTALKPFLLRRLLERGDDAVMYLDPDIEVFAPLEDLAELAAEKQILLTPHVLHPVPRDGMEIAEESFLISGQFNLGFISVSAEAEPFLEYWSERTQAYALRDPGRGYFTDQRWVDAVPAMFEHAIVRDPACNVAYWNLHERSLELESSGRWLVDGKPLRFFHFSGHRPGDPYDLSIHLIGPTRVRLYEHAALRRLLRERAERLLAIDRSVERIPYRWARTADGMGLSGGVRRLYWETVRAAERENVPPPVHAFGPDRGKGFVAWLREPVADGSPVSRHLHEVWKERPDLRAVFRDPLGADSASLVSWASVDEAFVESTPAPLRLTPQVPGGLPGVNVVGYLGGEFGVGAAGRMVTRMVRAAGVPLASTLLVAPDHAHRHPYHTTIEGAPFSVSVFTMNADGLVGFANEREFAQHRDRHRVGVWYWEVGSLPASMRSAHGLVDEVWCASEHVRDLLTAGTDRPVRKHPIIIDVPVTARSLTRDDLGLPEDRFLLGFAFDYSSVIKRKNPLGLIEAYRRAFGPDDGATLVLKSIRAEQYAAAAGAVHDAVGDRPDIVLLDRHLDSVQMHAFFDLLDCYVSLHRSEGLGLTIAAAMAAGTPAVATGWSGNLEFMNAENSALVPFDLAEVGPGADPYSPTTCWAEPDLDAAAALMRRLHDDPAAAVDLGRRGRASIIASHDARTAATWFVEQFANLTGIGIAV